jgi:hypothetical protein
MSPFLFFSNDLHIKKAYLKSILSSSTEIIALRDFIEAIKKEGLDNPVPFLSTRLHLLGNNVNI